MENTKATQQEIDLLLSEYDDNIIALAIFLNDLKIEEPTQEELETIREQLEEAKKMIDDGDYLSLTDEEADDARDESIDNYIDDCVLPELPANLQNYFDYDAFKRDCSFDGRGNQLAGYDLAENEQEYNGTTYYIYRNN